MQVSNWIIFGAAEVFAVLAIICAFLLFHTRNLKGLVNRLQDRIQGLISDLKQAKADIQKAEAQGAGTSREAYLEHLDQLIDQTREFHSQLNPDRDIALDLSNDSPLPRQVAALRFASLISEKEAVLASDSTSPDWGTLEDKFTQLVNFFRGEAIPTIDDDVDTAHLRQELDNSLQRVENLEKFKTLFFQMEDQWREAKQQADTYHEQLSGMQVGSDQQASFDEILNNYNNVYNQLGQSIQMGASATPEAARVKTVTNTVEITKTDPRSQNELRQLRSVAEEQHRLINELQNKLRNATSPEEKDAVIKDLQTQLERQIRFVQESETCIQLLENEISEAHAQVHALEADKEQTAEQLAEIPEMKSAIGQYTEESKELLKTIDRLEQENRQLVSQAEMASATNGTNSEAGADNKELAKLKQQYAELEARYLELRMQG